MLAIKGIFEVRKASLISTIAFPKSLMVVAKLHGCTFLLASSKRAIRSSNPRAVLHLCGQPKKICTMSVDAFRAFGSPEEDPDQAPKTFANITILVAFQLCGHKSLYEPSEFCLHCEHGSV